MKFNKMLYCLAWNLYKSLQFLSYEAIIKKQIIPNLTLLYVKNVNNIEKFLDIKIVFYF